MAESGMRYVDAVNDARQRAQETAMLYRDINSAADATAEENCDAEVGEGGDPTATWESLAARFGMTGADYRALYVREYIRAGGPCSDAAVAS